MAKFSPYRALSAEKRLALVTHKLKSGREAHALYVQRLIARKAGGFRAVTIQAWPVEQLAREVVRTRAESADDELDLLHLLYVQLEPAIQITFLEAAGVAHENGSIAEDLEAPYADAAGVERGVAAVRAAHGDDGEHYLRTLARYNRPAWPGIEALVGEG